MFKLKMVEKPELLNLKTNVEFPPVYVQTDHSKLENLDYKNSGHIGFASSDDLENKVDKIDGKGLSTNDYTNDEKNKLAKLENYTLPIASNTKLGGIKIGENLTITEDGILSAKGGGGGGINVVYTLEGTSSNNPLIIDRATLNVGDYILFKDNYNYLKFTETTKGYLTVEKGLYQIMNNPENVGGAMAGSKFIMMSLSNGVEKMMAIDIENTQNLSSYFSLTKAQLDIKNLDKVLISDYSSQQSITSTLNFITLPISNINPTDNNHFTRKGYVDALPTTYAGYDATKTQVLKNINGVLTWQDE